MTRQELKTWAKNKISGNIWNLLAAILVAGLLTGISIPYGSESVTYGGEVMSISKTLNIGWLLYFIEVGLVYYMVEFIKDNKPDIKGLFRFSKDFGRCLGTCILMSLLIFLHFLLLIVPGIIKAYAYALVPYILADEKYKDLSIMDVLKLSEEMMKGHKTDAFVLGLSFIGWALLVIPTFGLILIYLAPYMHVTFTKFYYDIKTNYERENSTLKDKIEEKANDVKDAIEEKVEEKKEEISKKVKEQEEIAKDKVETVADEIIDKVDEI